MERAFSLFLAGDAILTRPWSHIADSAFLRLVEEIHAADVAIANLETVIHEFKGYAQADSGGTHLASPPEIAAELKWAGFDMLAHANNHTFDYGSTGVLETIEHVDKAGLTLAGSGRDLQTARMPRYLCSDGVIVALVAMTASFIPYGKASRSRADLHGRPGLNPLTLTARERAIVIPPRAAERIRALGRIVGRKPHKLKERSFAVGFRFHVGNRFGIERARQLAAADRLANLEAISEAAGKADIVVASVHAHNQGRWLREFAYDAIEHGADIVFVHGPHEVRAIELRHGKPIFYSMGDFVFEVEHVARLPSEAYERLQLGDDASAAEFWKQARNRASPLVGNRAAFEGFATSLSIVDGHLGRIRLVPLDLQFDGPSDRRGRPQIADPVLGRSIIATVAQRSQPYGTRIRYDADTNCGEVEIP